MKWRRQTVRYRFGKINLKIVGAQRTVSIKLWFNNEDESLGKKVVKKCHELYCTHNSHNLKQFKQSCHKTAQNKMLSNYILDFPFRIPIVLTRTFNFGVACLNTYRILREQRPLGNGEFPLTPFRQYHDQPSFWKSLATYLQLPVVTDRNTECRLFVLTDLLKI